MISVVPPDVSLAPLVGRTVEVRRLRELTGLDGGVSGHVLLGGDAGVGKSRLITELATQAKAAQWRVLVGHCLDFGESALSYLAFSEALGRLALDEAAMAASLVESNPAIFSLLPSHRMLTETPDRERTMDRVSLLEAIHSTLTQLGRDAPLMLVVEDLHWADRSTRELLTFLFTRGFASQVTIVASYRSDDLHRAHPLRSTLTTWARIAGVTRLQVSPLEDPQMRLLIESLNPSALPEAETQKLLDRAEGNPFYLEELLAAVQSGGSQLPSDLADLMLLRLDQLDDAARLVVRGGSRRQAFGASAPCVWLRTRRRDAGSGPAPRGRGQRPPGF